MKHLLKFFLIALTALSLASCDKEPAKDLSEPPLAITPTNINGSWQLTEWNGAELPDGRYFYIEFIRRGMLFKSYENTSSAEVHKETGEYNILTDESLGGSVILGRFDNSMGQEWNHRYIVTSLTATRMVWTAADNPEDISVFTRIETIPSEITGESAE